MQLCRPGYFCLTSFKIRSVLANQTVSINPFCWTTGICTPNPASASFSTYSVLCTETVVAEKQLVSNDHLFNNTVRDCHTHHSSTSVVNTFSSLLASGVFIVYCYHPASYSHMWCVHTCTHACAHIHTGTHMRSYIHIHHTYTPVGFSSSSKTFCWTSLSMWGCDWLWVKLWPTVGVSESVCTFLGICGWQFVLLSVHLMYRKQR